MRVLEDNGEGSDLSQKQSKYDNAKVVIIESPSRGRGIAAAQDVAPGELIVSAPVLILSGVEYYLMRILPCIMHTFVWDRPKAQGGETAVIAFGLASLCNHADNGANAEVLRDYDEECLDLVALRTIKTGEEILIRYKSVPFEPT